MAVLSLDSTPITDVGLMELKNANALKYLNVRNTKVTDAGLAELKKSIPECRISN